LIKSSRIQIARNFADFDFGSIIGNNDRERVFEIFEAISGRFSGDLAGKLYPLATMSAAEQ
jgi:hypothetical protein